MSNSNPILNRFLYPCDKEKEVLLDENGLLLVSEEFRKYSNIIDLDEFSQLPGAILLAEGGMGKTTFMTQLENKFPVGQVHLVELGLFLLDPEALRKNIESFLQTIKEDSKPAIIFDGLDEAQDLAGAVLRLLGTIPEGVSVWIASRYVESILSIQLKYPELKSYNLAPLSEQNIRELVSHSGLDEDSFLEAAKRQGIVGICSKPLGCELAISVFGDNGLTGVGQHDLWQRGIKRLCDEKRSGTRNLLPASPYELEKIVDCSAWMALCLTLSGNVFLWVDEPSYCPNQCVDISSLSSNEFPLDLFRTTLERGVFTPLGDGRIRFTHAIFLDYLAAYGFEKFIPSEHWSRLLLNNDRKGVLPQRSGIAAWLTAFNKGFLNELAGIQPEILLSSVDAIQAIGPSKLCTALLDRSDTISSQQRHSEAIANNLFHLMSIETSSVIRNRLLDGNATESEIEFAIEIAEACKCSDLSNILAERALDNTLPLRQRVDAAHAIYRLEDNAAQGRLKALLPIDPKNDPQDDLRGNILRCCWPNHLTPAELLPNIIRPQKPNYLGPYGVFLDYNLPKSFQFKINENNAYEFLEWCIPYINQEAPFDTLGQLARSIYNYCWQWASNHVISALLAKGYLQAKKNYTSPFFSDIFPSLRKTDFVITQATLEKDTARRIDVIETLLQSEDVNEKVIFQMSYDKIPLIYPSDAENIFNKILSNPTGPLVSKWCACLKAIIGKIDLIQFSDKIDMVHVLLPKIVDSSYKIMTDLEESRKQIETLKQNRKKEEDDYNLKHQANQARIDSDIKTTLQQTDLMPDQFGNIAAWLFSKNGYQQFGTIDLMQSPGWAKLSPEEQETLIALSEQFLLKGNIKPTPADKVNFVVAQALYLLFILKPDKYQHLTKEVWEKCSVELLQAAFKDDWMEQLGPLFDTLSKKFPEIAEKALLNMVEQELGQNHISIIHYWGTRLTKAQAKSILKIAQKPETSATHSHLILDKLSRNGQTELVSSYLDKQFNSDWELPPNKELSKHLLLAFNLNPNKYGNNILEVINKNHEWGKQWIEMSVMEWEGNLYKAIVACIPDTIADFYLWLHNEYPENTRPEHNDIIFSPEAIDNIHRLQSHLITTLMQSGIEGSSVALKKIQTTFPSDTWLQHCIIDAQTSEQANKAPILSIAEIKLLCDKNSAVYHLIYSIQDLNDLIFCMLMKYSQNLQGDRSAVRDLWNTGKQISPKKEEDLSDHLKGFLDLTIKSEVIINREVQIQRKHYKNGKRGSKTDIWIQAFDKDRQVLTLCIEVKCNWNHNAKTALKDQLIDKYMSGGTAKAGILLLGWFACKDWGKNDIRQSKSTKIWADFNAAKIDLENQAEQECTAGHRVSAMIIDCSL